MTVAITLATPNSVLGKVASVLDAFSADDAQTGFSELQRRTGLPKATLHRLLGELETLGLVTRCDVGYRLGEHLLELGMRAAAQTRILDTAVPLMERLRWATRQTVQLGMRDRTDVVYLARLEGEQPVHLPHRVGGRMPLRTTAIGKALLARAPREVRAQALAEPMPAITSRTVTSASRLLRELHQIEQAGIAFEIEESAPGLACIAVAIPTTREHELAISIVGGVRWFRPEKYAADLRATAVQIAAGLDRRPAPRRTPGAMVAHRAS